MKSHNPKHGLEATLLPLTPTVVLNDFDSLPSYNDQLRQTATTVETENAPQIPSPPSHPPSFAMQQQEQQEEEIVVGPNGTRKRLKMSKQEADTLKAEMNQLLQELDEAHQRIGQLTAVLDNKLSKQLIKGLLKPFNK